MIRPLLLSLLFLAPLTFARHVAAQAPAQQAEEEDEAIVKREPQRISGAITTDPPRERLRLAPPFAKDRAGDITTRAVFPFYFERKGPSLSERFIVPQYYRRSPQLNADVTLGLVWSLRGPERNTFVLGPIYGHHDHEDWGAAFVPLFSAGNFSGHSHLVIPPLLTWMDGTEKTHRRVVALYYDVKKEDARWRGLAPLVWAKRGDAGGFTVLPPLYWRFTTNDPFEALTVVPPFYHVRTKDETKWSLMPLIWRKKNPDVRATTIPWVLFHHARGPNEFRLVLPGFAYLSDRKANTHAWYTPVFQQKRGDKNFDAVAPFYIRTWDNRDMSHGLYFPPLYYHWEDPANRYTTFLPFYLHNVREGISDTWLTLLIGRKRSHERDEQTWWMLPTFHWGWTPDDKFFNLHPVIYTSRAKDTDHTVALPLYFDFHNRKEHWHRTAAFPFWWDFKDFKIQKRNRVLFPFYYHTQNAQKNRYYKVAFPFYWDFDFRDRSERYTVTFPFHVRQTIGDRARHYVLNTMTEPAHGRDQTWQFHAWPFFARGGNNISKWWSLFYGLVGYERRGNARRMQLFWLPIELKNKAAVAKQKPRPRADADRVKPWL